MGILTAEGLQETRQEERERSPSNRYENDRESIWTIPTKLKRWYFALFSVQVVAATGWIIWTGIDDETVRGPSEILLHLWQYLAPAAIASATFALVIVDTVNGIMVLSTWLEEVLEKRKQRQIRDAAVTAREDERQRWLGWNRRREEAAAAGKEFDEPPPSANGEVDDPQP